MPHPTNEPTSQTEDTAASPVSVEAWLRAPVTLTLQRWMLLAGGLAALVLPLVALD